MPRCEGRPEGVCPDNRNDRSVCLCQGDLMLCEACEHVRFPACSRKAAKLKKEASKKSSLIAHQSPAENILPAAVNAGDASYAAGDTSHAAGTVHTDQNDSAIKSTAEQKTVQTDHQVIVSELLCYMSY